MMRWNKLFGGIKRDVGRKVVRHLNCQQVKAKHQRLLRLLFPNEIENSLRWILLMNYINQEKAT